MSKGFEWTPIYLVVIIAIAAILIFAIVKPMFQQAAQYAQASTGGVLLAGLALSKLFDKH